jgi:hypothetical protein
MNDGLTAQFEYLFLSLTFSITEERLIMKFRKLIWPVLALSIFAWGCSEDDDNPPPPQSPGASTFGPDVAKQWMDLEYTMIRSTGWSPPVASRIYGYTSIALYEAVTPGAADYQSLAGQLIDMPAMPQAAANTVYDWPTVANHAVADVMTGFFAAAHDTVKAHIAPVRDSWDAARQAAVAAEVFDRSVLLGQAIAAAVLEWASTDGYTAYNNCAYTPPTGDPSYWVPTPPNNAAPLQPCWGQLRTFLIEGSGATQECSTPGLPPTFSTTVGSDFYNEANEVFTIRNNITAEQTAIANFWADGPTATGTPAGHWVRLTGQLLVEQNEKLDVAAEAYARVGISVHDAFIVCWNVKYRLSLLRPITYIRRYMDSTWTPLLTTPNFPECTSGHSSQSGATSRALEGIWGTGLTFTDNSHADRGLPARSFGSIAQAADEAALSRLYGGIHYRSGNDLGLLSGRCIGDQVNLLHFLKVNS